MKFLIEIDDEELNEYIMLDEGYQTQDNITQEDIYCYVSGLIGVNHSNYEIEIVEDNPMTNNSIIIYAIKDNEGNYFNSKYQEFRPLAQNTNFYKSEQTANNEKLNSLRRHHSTQYDKLEDRCRGTDYYRKLRDYVNCHINDFEASVVALKIQEIDNNE